jgi:sigma-B regulation protein RsbU (phosphoserine phosphatase)
MRDISDAENFNFDDVSADILESVILIVDDDELHCQLIAIILTQDGFKNLHFARDGCEALQKARDLLPDMIILDILMPNIDGLEVCRELRKMRQFRNIPIIAHTIKHNPDDRAEIYDAGATDIFPKPVSEREVQNRVYMHLKYSRLVKGLKQYHLRLTRDLEEARSMQDALMPTLGRLEDILKSHGLDIDFQYEASNELGGDFWGVEVLDMDRLFIYIADFSGHGVSASLNTFRLHSLISNYQSPDRKNTTPAEYLEKLNRDLFRLLPVEQYATMLCGIIDLKKDIFTYAAAASTVPVKLTVGTGQMTCLDPIGFPLGMIEDASYDVHEVSFAKGELLFLYSDVLTESQVQNGRMIGNEYFLEMCQQTSANLDRSQKFLDRLMNSFDQLVVRPLRDDLTAVTLKRL